MGVEWSQARSSSSNVQLRLRSSPPVLAGRSVGSLTCRPSLIAPCVAPDRLRTATKPAWGPCPRSPNIAKARDGPELESHRPQRGTNSASPPAGPRASTTPGHRDVAPSGMAISRQYALPCSKGQLRPPTLPVSRYLGRRKIWNRSIPPLPASVQRTRQLGRAPGTDTT